MEKRNDDLIKKYRVSENLPEDLNVTEAMIWHHWNLERELTRLLMESTPETRWEVFEQAYTRFYSELTWLSLHTGDADLREPSGRYRDWAAMIGQPPGRIYEVGSGSAKMLSYLASSGFECKATDITRERREKTGDGVPEKLSWGNSDGVNLDLFEPSNFYDVVVSDQVLEHLHPDDLERHFKSVLTILKPGGRYIFNTPHCYLGPHDVSQVFECDEPHGMHLKEYTFLEMVAAAEQAGFTDLCYVVPVRLRNLAYKMGVSTIDRNEKLEKSYLKIMRTSESFLSLIPKPKWRKYAAKLLKKFKFFKGDIFLSAKKQEHFL